MTKNKPKQVVAFDLGTKTILIAVSKDGKSQVLKFAGSTNFESCVYRHPNGKTDVGDKAKRRAYKNPANYFANFKPAMKQEDVAVLSEDGEFTVIDAFAALAKHMFSIAKQSMPGLAGYPQFGGNRHPATDLLVAVTIPANGFGFTEAARYKESFVKAGFPESYIDDVAFFKEPYAAAHAALAEQNLSNLLAGDLLVVIDLGDGTLDITLCEFKDNQLHVKTAHSGVSDLGGSNLTAAVAEAIGDKLGIPFVCFTRGIGLSFAAENLDGTSREEQFAIWTAATDAKHQLSLDDSAFVTVATADGTKEVELEAADLGPKWVALYEEIEAAITNALGDSGLSWPDVKWVVAAGGGSRTRGMHQVMARATSRPTNEVLYCDEPQHAIVEGAVQMGLGMDGVTIAVTDTWGFTYPHVTSHKNVNEVYIEAGRLMPPEGIDESKLTTKVKSGGKAQVLELHPFIAKQTVLANPGDHLGDSEIIRLAPVQVELDLPTGEHAVCVRLRTDATQKWVTVLTFPDMPDREAVVVNLSADEDGDRPTFTRDLPNVIVLFDSSGSMAGSKIVEARDSTCAFLSDQMKEEIECAVIDFGGNCSLGVDFTTDVQAATDIVQAVEAGDGTAMADGLSMAQGMCVPEKDTVVVMFSDGYPQSQERTVTAAAKLRKHAELYTIAIGESADVALLKSIASSESHFFPIGRSRDLTLAFESIATLIYTGGNRQLSVPTKAA